MIRALPLRADGAPGIRGREKKRVRHMGEEREREKRFIRPRHSYIRVCGLFFFFARQEDEKKKKTRWLDSIN